MNQEMMNCFWMMCIDSAKNLESSSSARCLPEFKELISQQVAQYCTQQPPITSEELSQRQSQLIGLMGIVGSVADASRNAMHHQSVSAKITAVTKAFSDRNHPRDFKAIESLNLTQEIFGLVYSSRQSG